MLLDLSLQAPETRAVPSPSLGRADPGLAWYWLAAALDELDYGILLLAGGGVVHTNHAARVELGSDHPLCLVGGQLRARLQRDEAVLHAALRAAAGQGLRKLLMLGADLARTSVSIVRLVAGSAASSMVLVVLGKRAVSESLSIRGFARGHALTSAETRVLELLCGGLPPRLAAERLGVAISTVRSHLGSIRAKTGAASLRALVRQVAVLPPVKGLLREGVETQ